MVVAVVIFRYLFDMFAARIGAVFVGLLVGVFGGVIKFINGYVCVHSCHVVVEQQMDIVIVLHDCFGLYYQP